jgi:hypothetical protein
MLERIARSDWRWPIAADRGGGGLGVLRHGDRRPTQAPLGISSSENARFIAEILRRGSLPGPHRPIRQLAAIGEDDARIGQAGTYLVTAWAQ